MQYSTERIWGCWILLPKSVSILGTEIGNDQAFCGWNVAVQTQTHVQISGIQATLHSPLGMQSLCVHGSIFVAAVVIT